MYRRRPDRPDRAHPFPAYAFTEHMFNHPPAAIIRRVTAFARRHRASREYRYLMTTVDAIVFSRPDYGELRALATAIGNQHDRRQRP